MDSDKTLLVTVFSRRFRRKSTTLTKANFFRQFNAIGSLFCSFVQLRSRVVNPDFSSNITFQSSDITFSKLGCNVFKFGYNVFNLGCNVFKFGYNVFNLGCNVFKVQM